MLKINSKIYPQEAVLSAAYAFLDKAYIFLDKEPKGQDSIFVSLTSKKNDTPRVQKRLEKEFLNELLYSALRHHVARNNKKIREYILGRALYSPITDSSSQKPLAFDSESDYLKDPLGIAIPWEEKYGKKKGCPESSKMHQRR